MSFFLSEKEDIRPNLAIRMSRACIGRCIIRLQSERITGLKSDDFALSLPTLQK